VRLNLSGPAATEVIAAIGLLDLYGPSFYPDHITAAVNRYTWAKHEIERRVANPRFRQHFAVHELEAWLLADPNPLPQPVRAALPKVCAQPESVDFQQPPARLLDSLYRAKLNRQYRKIVDGTNLFAEVDPDTAYGKCPSLRALLDEMLSLAKGVGL